MKRIKMSLKKSKKFNLQSIIRKKRKYSSYKGQAGRIADNHIKRDFEATASNQNGLQM